MVCKVTYFTQNNEVYWKCPNNIGPRAARKMSVEKCWKYNCPGRQSASPSLFCSYEPCNGLRRSGSKYCSDNCRKKNANKAYKTRKKDEQSL